MPPASSDDEGEAWYVQGSYRLNDRFQTQAYYSVYWPDRNDKDGQRFVQRGQPGFRAWQKDIALTARVDINRHWLLKGGFTSSTARRGSASPRTPADSSRIGTSS